MDSIDKYYLVSELFDDDILKIVLAIKNEGSTIRPSRIHDDLTDFGSSQCLDKYIPYFNKIMGKYSSGTLLRGMN